MQASQPVGLSPGAINGVGLFVNTATKAFLPFTDLARGVLPTDVPGSWTTPPPNLANITDGSDGSFAGTGILAGAANDNIKVAMAEPDSHIAFIRAKIGAWNPLGTGAAQVSVLQGTAGASGAALVATASTTEVVVTATLTISVSATTNIAENQLNTVTIGAAGNAGTNWGFYCAAVTSACSFKLYTLEIWGIAR